MFLLTRILKFLLRIIIILILISVGFVLLYKFVRVPVTPLMLIRCVEQKAAGKPMTLKHDWVSLEEISSKLQLAVVCSEDQNYLKHYGFDWLAIEKALKDFPGAIIMVTHDTALIEGIGASRVIPLAESIQ